MNAANNGILKRLLGNQNLTVSFSEEETGDIIFTPRDYGWFKLSF